MTASVADTASRMGRPPLSKKSATQPTMVRLTVAVREQIEALVGENQMSAFIRDAVDEKLQRDQAELKRRERKPKGGEG